jgi:glycerophosphoryl diester phosphodiesterase
MIKPQFIAHRGYTRHYPENTLIGIEAALNTGARYIEIDVQLTSDHVPVLFHDDDLYRITGQHGNINDTGFMQAKNLVAGEPGRFGRHYQNVPVASLAELVDLLHRWPDARAFVEIKTESLDRFGIDKVTQIILEAISPLEDRCIPISYNDVAIQYARESGAHEIGWIIKTYDEKSNNTAKNLLPDYLFCNYTKLPSPPALLWPGPWRWALYEITDPALALTLADRGVELIETMEIGEMLQHPSIQDRLSHAD